MGGFFAPELTRERIIETICAWFDGAKSGWRPKVLDNDSVESSVARGAAYYGQVRRGIGLRVGAGSARTYGAEASVTARVTTTQTNPAKNARR